MKHILGMPALAALSSTYLPWTASAMRPSAVVAVLNEIVANQRRCVVELGGGVSTHDVGRMLKRRGGHLWTVEHDKRWADLLEQELAGEDLSEVVTVVRAPLTPISSPWSDVDARWYDRDVLTETLTPGSIDLLIVDGPPAYEAGKSHARYPAAGLFAPLLADDYAIVLDDINRAGEREIMQCWERERGIVFERNLSHGAIGVGRPLTI